MRKAVASSTGVNFSIGIRNPFQQLGFIENLSALLAGRYAGQNEPIVLVGAAEGCGRL